MKVILLGSAYPFRGGLAAFNERLIREFRSKGHDAELVTFTTQYPSLFFPGTTQYSTSAAPEGLTIRRMLSSVNPFTWWKTGRYIRKAKPDILVIKYWMPFMAPCLGAVARIALGNRHSRVICIADNIIPHETHFYDKLLTTWFIRSCHAFVTMSDSVLRDLARFDRKKLRASNPHPLFDNFGEPLSKEKAAAQLGLPPDKRYVLFFGFIRAYKGLDLLLEAFRNGDRFPDDLQLIVAGEFYTDPVPYKDLADPSMAQRIHWFDRFIPDEEVAAFFSLADLVVQPYKDATQSGVTQIAYHFDKPMVVTNVGGLPELVPDGECGWVVEPSADSIANAIERYFSDNDPESFKAGIRDQKARFGWDRMVDTLIRLKTQLG
jgi:D-inositol-3-phosphate glycosyltransferase